MSKIAMKSRFGEEFVINTDDYPCLRFGEGRNRSDDPVVSIPPVPTEGGSCRRITKEEAYAFFAGE